MINFYCRREKTLESDVRMANTSRAKTCLKPAGRYLCFVLEEDGGAGDCWLAPSLGIDPLPSPFTGSNFFPKQTTGRRGWIGGLGRSGVSVDELQISGKGGVWGCGKGGSSQERRTPTRWNPVDLFADPSSNPRGGLINLEKCYMPGSCMCRNYFLGGFETFAPKKSVHHPPKIKTTFLCHPKKISEGVNNK